MERWYTILEIVDTETGEIINKKEVENNNYRIINKQIKYEKNERYQNIRKITWECRKHEQYRIEL